jgi:prepilin signal peptidase PulO-like enzyme (type II secretory pathway)
MCPECKHELSILDLVPIVSFFLLHGRCRYCETKVSWQYPLVEALSGALFVVAGGYVHVRMSIVGVSSFYSFLIFSIGLGVIFSLFLFFAVYDLKHYIVPNKVVIPSVLVAFFGNVLIAVLNYFCPSLIPEVFQGVSFVWNIGAGLIGGIFITLIILLTKGKGMGGGDLKLMALMGLVLGIKGLIIALYLSVILGSMLGLIWSIRNNGLDLKKIRKTKLPFALFLSIGTVLSVLYGDVIWKILFGI